MNTRVVRVHPLAGLQASAGNRAVQRLLAVGPSVQRYRPATAMNFGAANASLKEQSFKSLTKQPWLSSIAVEFDSVVADSHGVDIPKGTATASYFSNAHALPSFSVPATGGPTGMRSDPGTFTVHRIEGIGYNDPTAAADIAAAEGTSALEGPKRGEHRRYTKPKSGQLPREVAASMHLAIFYNRGEAVHLGNLGLASHGCVHVDHFDLLTQLNYHSVIGRTRVTVRYTGAAKTTFVP